MEQKMVIKVPLHCPKCCSVALKTAAGVSDVDSIALKVTDCTMEVTGDGVDAVELVTSLRKKMKYAELVSVGPAGGEKNQEESEEQVQPLDWSTYQGGLPRCDYGVVTVDTYCHSWNCAIM